MAKRRSSKTAAPDHELGALPPAPRVERSVPPPLVFEVGGRPVPKGSTTAFVVKNKQTGAARAVVAQGGSKARRASLGVYVGDVREAARRAITGRDVELESPRFVGWPLEVELEFRLARPKNHYRTGRNAHLLRDDAPPRPDGMPDIDKLARSTLDALTGTAFDDDKRVARLVLDKVFAEVEGVRIRVAVLGATHLRVIGPDVTEAEVRRELGFANMNPPPPRAIADALQRQANEIAAKVAPGLPPPQLELRVDTAPLAAGLDTAAARLDRLRKMVPPESAAMRPLLDTGRARCDGEHAAPACGDRHCYHGEGTPDTRALVDELEHAWEKSNLVTKHDRHGVYDTYRCSRCGATAKRFGVLWPPRLDSKQPETCPRPPAVEVIELAREDAELLGLDDGEDFGGDDL